MKVQKKGFSMAFFAKLRFLQVVSLAVHLIKPIEKLTNSLSPFTVFIPTSHKCFSGLKILLLKEKTKRGVKKN